MNLQMAQRWMDLTSQWSIDPSQASKTFEEIQRQYTEHGRFYHTLDHIRDVLAVVEDFGSHAKHLNAVRLAAWLHDVIYDSRASDNEVRSAAYSTRLCERLAIPEGSLVASLVLKTKTHLADNDPDAQVLLDADLAVLGARPAVYRVYARNIRLEYAWVSEPEYRKGRRRVLESFLTRPRIYQLLSDLEQAARVNIAAEILDLADA
jgi:predicted metal-dependent HD superfamily phosphohydrolase